MFGSNKRFRYSKGFFSEFVARRKKRSSDYEYVEFEERSNREIMMIPIADPRLMPTEEQAGGRSGSAALVSEPGFGRGREASGHTLGASLCRRECSKQHSLRVFAIQHQNAARIPMNADQGACLLRSIDTPDE